jgi:hypothetical protein
MTAAGRLDVYREQFWLRHLASLEEDYPTLAWAIGGRDAFRRLATEYLADTPPAHWDLQRLGERLPPYVGRHPSYKLDLLACEGARLDWAFMEAFDAKDEARFDPSVLTTVSEDALPMATVAFHPSLRQLVLAYPMHELRDAIKTGATPERPPPLDPDHPRWHLVVWRDDRCWLRAAAIDAAALDLLESLAIGTSLGHACEEIAQKLPAGASELGPKVASWFQEWTARGWVTSVRLP